MCALIQPFIDGLSDSLSFTLPPVSSLLHRGSRIAALLGVKYACGVDLVGQALRLPATDRAARMFRSS
jgi:hypothetical protein